MRYAGRPGGILDFGSRCSAVYEKMNRHGPVEARGRLKFNGGMRTETGAN